MNSDNQCAFDYDGTRCPFPGALGETIKGNGPLYCRWHANSNNRGNGAAQHDFFTTYAKNAECIKDTLELWYGGKNWRDQMVDDLVAKHPEWKRRDDETKSTYVSRMTKITNELR